MSKQSFRLRAAFQSRSNRQAVVLQNRGKRMIKLLAITVVFGSLVAVSLSLIESKPFSVEASVEVPSSSTYENQKAFLLDPNNSKFKVATYQADEKIYLSYGSKKRPMSLSLPKCDFTGSELLKFRIEIKRFGQDYVEISNACGTAGKYLKLNRSFVTSTFYASTCTACVTDEFTVLNRERALSFFGETEIRTAIQVLLCLGVAGFFLLIYRQNRNRPASHFVVSRRYLALGLLWIIAISFTIQDSPPARDLQINKVKILKETNFQAAKLDIELSKGSIPKGNVETFFAEGEIFVDSKFLRPMYRERQPLFSYGFVSGEIDEFGDLIIYVNRGSDGHYSVFAKGRLSPGIHDISIKVQASREVLVALDGKSYISAYADRPVFWGASDSAHRNDSKPSSYQVHLSKEEAITGFSSFQMELSSSSERLASISYAVNRLSMYLIFLIAFFITAFSLMPILGLRKSGEQS